MTGGGGGRRPPSDGRSMGGGLDSAMDVTNQVCALDGFRPAIGGAAPTVDSSSVGGTDATFMDADLPVKLRDCKGIPRSATALRLAAGSENILECLSVAGGSGEQTMAGMVVLPAPGLVAASSGDGGSASRRSHVEGASCVHGGDVLRTATPGMHKAVELNLFPALNRPTSVLISGEPGHVSHDADGFKSHSNILADPIPHMSNSSTSAFSPPPPSNFSAFPSHSPEFFKGNAWRKPTVVSLPSMESLGRVSDAQGHVILDDDDILLQETKLRSALVGRLFGRKIPYPQLSIELNKRWAAFGDFRLITLSGDCFLCFFDCAAACDAVLMNGPWVLFGQVLGVDRWTPSFSPSSLTGFNTPVWVRMPGLPLYCWSSLNIARICASIGAPLWIDSATAHLDRGLFARACIRLDLSKPLQHGIWVVGRHGRFFQPLEYEGLSLFCFRCRRVGHKEVSCKLPAPVQVSQPCPPPSSTGGDQPACGDTVLEEASPVIDPIVSVPVDVTSTEVGQQLENRGAGPWMLVVRKRRSHSAGKIGKIGNLRAHSQLVGPSPKAAGHGPQPVQQIFKSKVVLGQVGSGTAQSHVPLSGVWRAKTVQPLTVVGKPHVLEVQEDFKRFSALPKDRPARAEGVLGRSPCTINAQLARAACSFTDRLVRDLGPVIPGSRKRRKSHSVTDGGDASPSSPT